MAFAFSDLPAWSPPAGDARAPRWALPQEPAARPEATDVSPTSDAPGVDWKAAREWGETLAAWATAITAPLMAGLVLRDRFRKRNARKRR